MRAKGSCFSAGEGEGVWEVRGDVAPAQWDWPWRPSDELTPMKEVMVGDGRRVCAGRHSDLVVEVVEKHECEADWEMLLWPCARAER